ncbi:MAG: hypothetical protein K6A43_08600, partial [Treponema sp.]|nr:hypothetical protein [Treponema sp.]
KIITKTGLAAEVQKTLTELGIESAIFNDLPGEPTDLMIMAGVEIFKKKNVILSSGLEAALRLIRQKQFLQCPVFPEK